MGRRRGTDRWTLQRSRHARDFAANPPDICQIRLPCYVAYDVRRPRVVASTALIAALALVAVPGTVGSWVPNPSAHVEPDLFKRVEVAELVRGTVMMIQPIDPGARSGGNLPSRSRLRFDPPNHNRPQARSA